MPRLFRRILVPHDFSERATRALEVAADLAAGANGRVSVLHVLAPFYTGEAFPSAEDIAWMPSTALRSRLRARLEALVRERLGARARRVDCRVVAGDPVRAIVAAGRRADVIVMSTFGRTGLARALIGSVAERVVRHATVPVLTVRPRPRRRMAARRS